MHYIVTGGAGFIGSHLSNTLLAQGHQVSVIDNLSTGQKSSLHAGIKFIDADIAEPNNWSELFSQADGCFHLAAVASVARCTQHPNAAHHSNVIGTLSVFKAALTHNTPIVFASSSAVYGNSTGMALNESAATYPESIYAVDKLSAELYARIFYKSYGLQTIGLRFFNVYGPGQLFLPSLDSGVIANFSHQILEHEAITIKGDGEQTRDFIYVKDAIEALQLAMQHSNKDASLYNVGTGTSHSINTIIEQLKNLFSRQVKVEHLPAQIGDVKHSLSSIEKIQTELKFTPHYSLEMGLAELAKHIDSR